MTPKIKRVMRRRPLAVGSRELRAHAARKVGRRGLPCVPVVQGRRVVGVVSYADLDGDGAVEERMRPAVCVEPDERADAALSRVAGDLECLPVVLAGRLVGVTSVHELRMVIRAEAVEAMLE